MKNLLELTDQEREMVEKREDELREAYEEQLYEDAESSSEIDLELESIEESRNVTFYEDTLPVRLENFEQEEHSRLCSITSDESEIQKQLSESIEKEKQRLISLFEAGEILPPISRDELVEDYVKEKLEKADKNERFFNEAMEELFGDDEES